MPVDSVGARSRARLILAVLGALLVFSASQSAPSQPSASPDFDRMARQQAETDRAWRTASQGFMTMDKIVYRSRAGDLDVPAFVFCPIGMSSSPKTVPALIWVHEDIRGHLYEHYIPFIRAATLRGYVVIAPEYRGGIGYGRAHYDAIDYGGAEVDDVVTAADVLTLKYAAVDPERIGIIGWSHGGLITLLGIARNPTLFKAAVAIAPVTNLFQRLAWKGVDRQRQLIDPQNRFGGAPSEKHDVYRDRSPLFQVEKLQTRLHVAVAANDEDVNIEETLPLIDALRARKPDLTETVIYEHPAGGHLFDRRVTSTGQPEETPEERDSWNRVWRFLGRMLTVPERQRYN